MDDPSRVGQTFIGRFRLEKVLGRGGMATVYEAIDLRSNRRCALKILKKELTRDTMVKRRFEREAKAASTLRHPNVIEVLEWGSDDADSYIAMELAEGIDLLKALGQERPMRQGRALTILMQVAVALEAAHGKGIVHRDLKPENILLVPSNEVPGGERAKVLDFGIAKILEAPKGASGDDAPSYVTRTALTRVGTIVGTPAYMSPEQCRGGEIDGRSDIYAIGVLLYQLVTGELPFTGETPLHTAMRHIHAQARPAVELRPDLCPAVARIIVKALSKWPGERHQSAAALRDDLYEAFASTPEAALLQLPADFAGRDPSRGAEARNSIRPLGGLGATPLKGVQLGRVGSSEPSPVQRPSARASDPPVRPVADVAAARIQNDPGRLATAPAPGGPVTAKPAAAGGLAKVRAGATSSEARSEPARDGTFSSKGPTMASSTLGGVALSGPSHSGPSHSRASNDGRTPTPSPVATSTTARIDPLVKGRTAEPPAPAPSGPGGVRNRDARAEPPTTSTRGDVQASTAFSGVRAPATAPSPSGAGDPFQSRQPSSAPKVAPGWAKPMQRARPADSSAGRPSAVMTETGLTPTNVKELPRAPTPPPAIEPLPASEPAAPPHSPHDLDQVTEDDSDDPRTFIREPAPRALTLVMDEPAYGSGKINAPPPAPPPPAQHPSLGLGHTTPMAPAPAQPNPAAQSLATPSSIGPHGAPQALAAGGGHPSGAASDPRRSEAQSGQPEAHLSIPVAAGGDPNRAHPYAPPQPSATPFQPSGDSLQGGAVLQPGPKNELESITQDLGKVQGAQRITAEPAFPHEYRELPSAGFNDATIVGRRTERKPGFIGQVQSLSGTTGVLIGVGLGLGIAAAFLILFLMLSAPS